ncbi:hypothetical protein PTKIN_Ptkin01aG0079700 [Pterospermum kingtungense]
MASTFRVFVIFLLALSLLLVTKARQLDIDHPATKHTTTAVTSLMARLKVDEESPDCWGSLIHLQSCTGELILFFLNGEAELGDSCCQAIRTISHHCWPTIIDALGFTTEETHVLEGYCDHEDNDQSHPSVAHTNVVGSTKLFGP